MTQSQFLQLIQKSPTAEPPTNWSEYGLFIEQHRLEAWANELWSEQAPTSLIQKWKSQEQKYKTMNLLSLTEITELQKLHSVLPLKGSYLLKHCYPQIQQRPMTDFDLLIDASHLDEVSETLIQKGYKTRPQNKTPLDQFKYLFHKETEWGHLTCELHTQLFYHEPLPSPSYLFMKEFPLEMTLVHLCGHYIFQHQFLKLFWLVDLILFTHKYEHRVNPGRLLQIAEHLHLSRSVKAVLLLIDHFQLLKNKKLLDTFNNIFVPPTLLDWSFIAHSRQHMWRLFYSKLFFTEKKSDFAKYQIYWLLHRFK